MEKVLIVEDSRMVKQAMKRMLSEAGFNVVDAANGEDALQLAQRTEPELIILDMMLPKMGGEQVLRSLKADAKTANIPVLVVSALPQKNAERLKHEGAIGYIEKSKLNLENSQDLVRLVRAALQTPALTHAGMKN